MLCKEDIIHWLKFWGWLHNPWKPDGEQDFPYIPYEFQEELILYLQQSIQKCNAPGTMVRENVIVEKCREMAGSWSAYAVILHDWMFNNGSYLVMSWKEEEVDQPGNLSTPFEKMRFMLRAIPDWMKPNGWDWKKCSNVGLLRNPKGATIEGEAMTGAAGAGGRVKAVIFDEFAKTQPGLDYQAWRSCSLTTRLRIAISTPEGPHNKFARLRLGRDNEQCTIISLNWWKDPIKCQQLSFVNNRPTSPWYEECKRTMDPQTLASQVDINYEQSQKGTVFEQYGDIHRKRTWLPNDPTRTEGLRPMEGHRIIVSIDPGVHWFTTWTQIDAYNRYLVLNEAYFENADIDTVAEHIIDVNNTLFNGFEIEYCGDPAGGNVNSAMHKLKSEYLYLLENYGINVAHHFMPRDRGEWVTSRIRAIQAKLTRIVTLNGLQTSAMMLVDYERCPLTDYALSGGYRWKTDIAGNIMNQVEQVHPYEDAADCVGYPLIYKGLYQQNESRGKRSVRRGVDWRPPSEMRRPQW